MRTLLTVFACMLIAFASLGQNTRDLKKQLAEIYRTDQLYRAEMAKTDPADLKIVDLVNKQDKIDSLNLIKVIHVLDSIGFPRKNLYGDSAGLGVFHVIQHSDVKYQEKYLPLFKQAVKQHELEGKWVAMMIDRVRVSKGLKQVYGTQMVPVKDPRTGYLSNKIEIAPIEKEDKVNERRARVGLGPIEEQAKQYGIEYPAKPKDEL